MEQKKITQGDLVSMFLRSNLQQAWPPLTSNVFMAWDFATT